MIGFKKIIGIVRKILANIGGIFGNHKGRKRENKSVNVDEIERDIQELNQQFLELNDEEMTKAIEEMTAFLVRFDKVMGLDKFTIKEEDLEIHRWNDWRFYYGYVHGGPYAAINYLSKDEKYQRWCELMRMLENSIQIKKIGP